VRFLPLIGVDETSMRCGEKNGDPGARNSYSTLAGNRLHYSNPLIKRNMLDSNERVRYFPTEIAAVAAE
jgi:hypothetical protein